MQSIKLCSHVGADGILHLEIPVGMTDKEMEVVVIYQQIEPSTAPKTPEELGWPPGFFEQTAGSLADDPIQRYPQGAYEARESLE
ncbi:hypothetical protein I8752_04405 [Nostocaceae cyanobacterium CENA369]|uniref:Uncharacterized protein n=1 Tax=Dendronalium phyllosphericum CENA369 TaxID=1725256 RepID=A0A8J7LBY5_9NOST|nr:hypothetical protein [Dendronalium phyllosphericum]MBH8572287.1 hypothetical protein [Dendronalium phyllosphericum CENA369]